MDPNELLRLTPHLQTIATTIVAGVPLAEIVKRIVLPSADVLGKRMADRVERCFGKTAKMIEDAGITPQPVPDKLVVEILQGAALEDNEDFHTMWAALLANAASPGDASKVRPGFVAILKQMSSDEANLLNVMRRAVDVDEMLDRVGMSNVSNALGWTGETGYERLELSLDGLEATQLIRRVYYTTDELRPSPSSGQDEIRFAWDLTYRGRQFLEACRPPKTKP